MKLFGLIEHLDIKSVFPLNPIPVPHPDLFKKLERYKLEKNISVGIQMAHTEKILYIPPIEVHNQKIFLDLYKYFNNSNKKVHFLESRKHFEDLAGIVKKGIEIGKKLEMSGDNQKELLLENYKLEMEYNYKRAIGINDSLLKNISQHKPDLVFVGDAHARWFCSRKKEIEKEYGIKIEEYWSDILKKEPNMDDLMWAASMSKEDLSMESLLEDEIETVIEKVNLNEDIKQDLEDKLIKRKYDAVNKGRITDGKPHFIGTWDLHLEPKGLFEIFIENKSKKNGLINFTGKIEDCLGSANVHGELSHDFITFTKRYSEFIKGTTMPNPINYHAKKSNEEFKGTYKIELPSEKPREFKMKQLIEIA